MGLEDSLTVRLGKSLLREFPEAKIKKISLSPGRYYWNDFCRVPFMVQLFDKPDPYGPDFRFSTKILERDLMIRDEYGRIVFTSTTLPRSMRLRGRQFAAICLEMFPTIGPRSGTFNRDPWMSKDQQNLHRDRWDRLSNNSKSLSVVFDNTQKRPKVNGLRNIEAYAVLFSTKAVSSDNHYNPAQGTIT